MKEHYVVLAYNNDEDFIERLEYWLKENVGYKNYVLRRCPEVSIPDLKLRCTKKVWKDLKFRFDVEKLNVI